MKSIILLFTSPLDEHHWRSIWMPEESEHGFKKHLSLGYWLQFGLYVILCLCISLVAPPIWDDGFLQWKLLEQLTLDGWYWLERLVTNIVMSLDPFQSSQNPGEIISQFDPWTSRCIVASKIQILHCSASFLSEFDSRQSFCHRITSPNNFMKFEML